MAEEAGLDQLREQVAETTREIIRLAGKRNDLARKIGELKAKKSLPAEDSEVEDRLLDEVISECDRARLDRSAGLRLFSVLLAESKKTQRLEPRSTPMAAFAKALELQRRGVPIIRLDVGEPDFRPPRKVLDACSEAMFAFKTHYTEARGIPELRAALRGYLERKRRFQADDGELTVTPSGRFAVFAALSGLVGEGESALVIEPNWPAYREVLTHLGARAIPIATRLEDGWEPSTKDIEAAVRPDTRAIVVSYPNNPSGKVISPDLFRQVTEIADERGLGVLSDEIYNEYTSAPCPSILDHPPRKFVLTSSFSKTWAMTGFRIGYAVSSKETIGKMVKMTSLMVTSVPEFIQYGAIRALDADAEVSSNVREMKERIEAVDEELREIGSLEYVKPDGAMYFFPRLRNRPGGGDSFAAELLGRGVSVTPGSSFGDYGDFFRISLGQPRETIIEGVRRIGKALG